MEFVRQIIDSGLLDKISLPQSLKNKKIEIIILPFNETNDESVPKISVDKFAGSLGKYKNLELIHLEKSAWSDANVDGWLNHYYRLNKIT